MGPKNPGPICSGERCKSKFQVQRIVGATLGVWVYDNKCGFFVLVMVLYGIILQNSGDSPFSGHVIGEFGI